MSECAKRKKEDASVQMLCLKMMLVHQLFLIVAGYITALPKITFVLSKVLTPLRILMHVCCSKDGYLMLQTEEIHM